MNSTILFKSLELNESEKKQENIIFISRQIDSKVVFFSVRKTPFISLLFALIRTDFHIISSYRSDCLTFPLFLPSFCSFQFSFRISPENRYRHEAMVDGEPVLFEILDTCPKVSRSYEILKQ